MKDYSSAPVAVSHFGRNLRKRELKALGMEFLPSVRPVESQEERIERVLRLEPDEDLWRNESQEERIERRTTRRTPCWRPSWNLRKRELKVSTKSVLYGLQDALLNLRKRELKDTSIG